MENPKKEEEKNNNQNNSISDSISGLNTSKEEDHKLTKLKNELNFSIETLNYEQAIILCKKILFFSLEDIEIPYIILYQIYIWKYTIYQVASLVSKKNEENIKIKMDLKIYYFVKAYWKDNL